MRTSAPPPETTVPLSEAVPATGGATGWGAWLAFTWLALLLLATLAEVGGFENLRLALDVQRSFAEGAQG